jgi:hypothetical protein
VTDLDELRRVAATCAALREQRDNLIRRAVNEGTALRTVGDAAGLTHTAVRLIASRDPRPFVH